VLGTAVTLTRAQSWSVPCACIMYCKWAGLYFWLSQFSSVLLLALCETFEVRAVPLNFLLCTDCPRVYQQAWELVHPSYYACAWGITDFLCRVFIILYLRYQVVCITGNVTASVAGKGESAADLCVWSFKLGCLDDSLSAMAKWQMDWENKLWILRVLVQSSWQCFVSAQ
jgi:hypothetical protein